MNEIRAKIYLREHMDSPEGWGRDQGREVFQQLLKKVETLAGKVIIQVSMEGVKRNDISFASETVVELAKRYRGNKGFCLTELTNEDLIENWDSAAAKKTQPLMVWNSNVAKVIGVQPSQGNLNAFQYIVDARSATASEVAEALGLQITNVSTKLKQLWEQGFLLRLQETAESGGVEFRYFAIG